MSEDTFRYGLRLQLPKTLIKLLELTNSHVNVEEYTKGTHSSWTF